MKSSRTDDGANKQTLPTNTIPRHSIHGLEVTRSSFYGPWPTSGLSPRGLSRDIHSEPASSSDPLLPIKPFSPKNTAQPSNIFTELRNPSLYQTLTGIENSYPLRDVSHSEPPNSLPELSRAGYFRDAAIKAAQTLINPEITLSPEKIFDLIYKRLACLTLCNQTALAVQELKALGDLNSSHYRVENTNDHFVPWELRILAVRLQGIGFRDVKRSVIGYYDLVSEVRLTITSLKKQRNSLRILDEEIKDIELEIIKWEKRLNELGLRVASALVEMEDFEGASRFLSTYQTSASTPNLRYQQALIWLFLGDVEAARNCAPDEKIITTLAHIADANFEEAVAGWEELINTGDVQEVAMWKQNLAVSLIYLGHIDKARRILEELTDEEYGFRALTFNLSTIYELSTEKSRSLKIGLADKLAKKSETTNAGEFEITKLGRDKADADFKL